MKFWTTNDFKALQGAWYQRLADEGFTDVEEMVGTEMRLKKTIATVCVGEIVWRDREAYYNFVSQKAHDTVFTSDVDRLILTLHAEGKKIKHICEELVSIGKQRTRHTVRFKIRIYEMQWGLRHYTPRQLNRKVS